MTTHAPFVPPPLEPQHRRGDDGNLLSRVLIDIERLIPCDRALIWLIDDAGQSLTTVVGRERGSAWNPGWTRPVEWSPFAAAIADGAFVTLPRERVPGLTPGGESPHARHFLIGPISDGNHTLGVLSLTRIDDKPFGDTDVQTLQTIAGLAAIAVRASLAIQSEREQRHRVMQTGILTAALNQSRTPEAVIDALLRGVARQVGIEHCYVTLISPANPSHADIHLAEPLRVDGRAVIRGLDPADRAPEAELRRTRRYISGPRLREMLEVPPVARPEGMHGLAAVPIRNGTRLDGVLYLWSPVSPDEPGFRDLSPAEIDMAESLCAQAAVALERTWLQKLAHQTANEQKILADFANQVSSAITSEEMALAALEALSNMMPVTTGRVTLVSDQSDGDVLGSWPQDDPIDAETCAALRLLEQWVRADTIGWSGALATWMPDSDTGMQVVCWPVASDDRPIGTLTVLRHGPEAFEPHEVDLVSQTGGQLGLGLQRARAHADAIIARDEAERNADLIAQLLHVSNEMSRQQDLDDVLSVMDSGLSSLIDFSVLEIYTADEEREQLDLIHFRAIDGRQPGTARMPFSNGAIGRSARLRRPAQGVRLSTVGQTRILAVPMVIEGQLLGVIAIGRDDDTASFTQQELSLLGIFSAHAASEISRANLARRNRELYLGGIRALTSTVDAKDPHTRGHSARVGRMARLIAEQMGLSREEVEQVELAGLLHDVGKVAIPDLILQKPGPLDQEERAIMMGHTEMGAHILGEAGSDVLEPLVPLVLHHHEWWDGRGYPRSLRGDDIPVGAQIIAVADAFDTMTHDRPYRKRSTVPEAWAELLRDSGSQFAPTVVAAAADAIAKLPPGERDDPLSPHRVHHLVEPLAEAGGQLGDLRSLGVLVGLARITSHMTDLGSLMEQTLAMLAERLDLSLLLVLGPGGRRHASVTAYSQQPKGRGVHPCPGTEGLDRLLGADLPANLESIPGLDELPLPTDLFRSAANAGVVALRTEDEITGALIFEPNRPDHYWRSDLQVIEAIAPHVSAAINVARMHEQVKEDALTDGLTGALNYRAFQQRLVAAIDAGHPFAVMMFDVVGLKPLNDTVGHLAGDQLLRHSVEVIRASISAESAVGRVGGDEFSVLLAGEEARDPRAIGRQIVARMERDVAAAYRHTVTLRFGWAAFPLDGRAPDLLLHVADQRMYLDQPSGRETR